MLNFSSTRATVKWQIANNRKGTRLLILLIFAEYGTEKQHCWCCCTGTNDPLDFCKCLKNCPQECSFWKFWKLWRPIISWRNPLQLKMRQLRECEEVYDWLWALAWYKMYRSYLNKRTRKNMTSHTGNYHYYFGFLRWVRKGGLAS